MAEGDTGEGVTRRGLRALDAGVAWMDRALAAEAHLAAADEACKVLGVAAGESEARALVAEAACIELESSRATLAEEADVARREASALRRTLAAIQQAIDAVKDWPGTLKESEGSWNRTGMPVEVAAAFPVYEVGTKPEDKRVLFGYHKDGGKCYDKQGCRRAHLLPEHLAAMIKQDEARVLVRRWMGQPLHLRKRDLIEAGVVPEGWADGVPMATDPMWKEAMAQVGAKDKLTALYAERDAADAE